MQAYAGSVQGQIYLKASIRAEARQEILPLLHLPLYFVQLKDQRIFGGKTLP